MVRSLHKNGFFGNLVRKKLRASVDLASGAGLIPTRPFPKMEGSIFLKKKRNLRRFRGSLV